jgi:hypothetical protein
MSHRVVIRDGLLLAELNAGNVSAWSIRTARRDAPAEQYARAPRRAVMRSQPMRRSETSGARAARDEVACRKGSSVGRGSIAISQQQHARGTPSKPRS